VRKEEKNTVFGSRGKAWDRIKTPVLSRSRENRKLHLDRGGSGQNKAHYGVILSKASKVHGEEGGMGKPAEERNRGAGDERQGGRNMGKSKQPGFC